MADVNNEREKKDARYAANLAALQRLVLYRFDDDSTGEGWVDKGWTLGRGEDEEDRSLFAWPSAVGCASTT